MSTHFDLAERTSHMGANMLREVLKVATRPGMLSLAGGMPAPESFPLEHIGRLAATVLQKYGSDAIQYSPTEGFPPLRAALADHLQTQGIPATAEEIHVTTGSQGALDAIGKMLISRGDRVAVEAPTYLGALQAFNPYQPNYVRLAADDHGLLPESLEEVLQRERVQFIYLVPTFQNPTGRTLPLDRRQRIADILIRRRALLVEDDPYSALRYQGESLPSIKSLAPENVIYVGSLSKVLAPGLRLGFYLAPAALSKWLVIAKQGVDLHTSTFNQAIAAEYLSGGYLAEHLPLILALYQPRREAMLTALERHFPDNYRWSRPQGGMFLWLEGPAGMDMERVYQRALAQRVAFVPGRYFFPCREEGRNAMRLNFTMCDSDRLAHAVAVIAEEAEKEEQCSCACRR